MKRIIILSLLLIALISKYGFRLGNDIVVAKSNILSVPNYIDVTDNETVFYVKLNQHILSNQRVLIKVQDTGYLSYNDKTIPCHIILSDNYLYTGGQKIKITVTHEDIENIGEYTLSLPIKYKVETYKQEKTVYASQTVSSWDSGNYTLDISEGNYKEETQYGYIEVSSFSNDLFSLEIPEDGFYQEVTQYGYQERTKKMTRESYKYTEERYYNNVGSCPLSCYDWTINNYGSGCACTIAEYKTGYRDVAKYGEWITNEDSWSNEDKYQESDTIQKITRTVYYLPEVWSEEKGWNYDEEYSLSNTIKPIQRTVYVLPKTYNELSTWSDQEPSKGKETKVISKQVCRLLINNEWSNWEDCD